MSCIDDSNELLRQHTHARKSEDPAEASNQVARVSNATEAVHQRGLGCDLAAIKKTNICGEPFNESFGALTNHRCNSLIELGSVGPAIVLNRF